MTDKADMQRSKRVDQHAAMLDEALRRPSVREVMEVYDAWQRFDEQLRAYRAATTPVPKITTTDRSNEASLAGTSINS